MSTIKKKSMSQKSASLNNVASSNSGGAFNPADFFLNILQDATAKPLVIKFKNFVKLCKEQLPDNPSERQRIIRKFCERVEKICKALPIFPQMCTTVPPLAGSTPQQEMTRCMDLLRDGIEKILMVKLYPLLFDQQVASPVHVAFQQKLQALARFIEPKHLDLPADVFFDHEKVQLAIKQLAKTAAYKAPKEKMICILNCCKVISSLMREYAQREPSSPAAKKIGNPPAADEVLSGLVLLLIKATPPHLKATSQYIRLYRHPAHLQLGEPGYYYTLFESAVDFIDTCTASKFSISPAEFELNMQAQVPQPASTLTKQPSQSGFSKSSSSSPSSLSTSSSSSSSTLIFHPSSSILNNPSPSHQSFPITPSTSTSSLTHSSLVDSTSFDNFATIRPAPPSPQAPARPPSAPISRSQSSSSSSSSRLIAADPWSLNNSADYAELKEPAEIRFNFLDVTVGDLKVSQVPSLLEEYKIIAHQNAQLRALLRKSTRSSNDNDGLAPFF